MIAYVVHLHIVSVSNKLLQRGGAHLGSITITGAHIDRRQRTGTMEGRR